MTSTREKDKRNCNELEPCSRAGKGAERVRLDVVCRGEENTQKKKKDYGGGVNTQKQKAGVGKSRCVYSTKREAQKEKKLEWSTITCRYIGASNKILLVVWSFRFSGRSCHHLLGDDSTCRSGRLSSH